MVYGFLVIVTFLVGTIIWGVKYYTDTNDLPKQIIDTEETRNAVEASGMEKSDGTPRAGDEEDPESIGKSDGSEMLRDKKKPYSHRPFSATNVKYSKPISRNADLKSGYVDNGWWQSDNFFSWNPSYFPEPDNDTKPAPIIPIVVPPTHPPTPERPSSWLQNIKEMFEEEQRLERERLAWLESLSQTTTTTEEPEYVTESEEVIVVTVAKDYLKHPPGGWGVDYNPYIYFNG